MRGRPILVFVLALAGAVTASAQITNGSFESAPDHLTGWVVGPGARVEALQAGSFTPNSIAVPDGAWFALLSNGPGDVPVAPGGDFDANGTADFDSSTLSTSFTTTVADERLSFSWAFLTDEVGTGAQGQALYDDLFTITIGGVSILRGSVNKPGGISPFPDTEPYDGLRYTVASAGLTSGSDFGSAPGGGRTPFFDACITISEPGTYTLEFLVADQSDSVYDTGLLIDAVEVASSCDPFIQVTNSDGASIEVKGGGFVFTPVANGRAATNGDGSILAFASNGDYNSDNPNLQPQMWVATRSPAMYNITRVTSLVGAEVGDPDISLSGRWIAFSSTGDLVPPGNADGNFEIFRYDRVNGTFLQLTTTGGCANSVPTINDGGDRIAFVSDCDLGFGATGSEIVLWDGAFRGLDTSGCVSRDPVVSPDVNGRYVSFVTDCDGQYSSNANPDGGLEIVQWDTLTDTYLQLTSTAAGLVNDVPSSSADGRFVAFLSNADHESGENPGGSLVVFRYDRTLASFLQLTPADPLVVATFAAIDRTGTHVAAERIDLLTAAPEIVLLDATDPQTLSPVIGGDPSLFHTQPAVAVTQNRPIALFQSTADVSGGNADGNIEIITGVGAFDVEPPLTICSSPNLAIPDNNNQGVVDTITIADTGILDDVDVIVRIEHTFVGDLRVTLRHVDTGTNRRLINRPGAPPGFGCSGDDIDATLDDEALSPVEDECVTPGPVAIDGTFMPDLSLDIFDGEDLSGDWQLTVSDRAAGDLGTLVEWCLVGQLQ